MQPETNAAYDPKNWPESDLVVYPPTEQQELFPSPEVQAQAADLIAVAEEQANAVSGADPVLSQGTDIDGVTYHPIAGGGTKLPDYYRKTTDGTIIPITKAEYKRGMLKEFTVKHHPLPCGHKLIAGQPPRHRNCQACWFTFFQVHGELTQAVDEAYNANGTEVGKALITQLRGVKFFKNFLRFMSTVAAMKAKLETQTADV